MRRCGFTFVEVTVALVLSAFVTLVAVGAMKSVTSSAQRVRQYSDMAAELRWIVAQLRTDLDNLYRDTQRDNVKLQGGELDSRQEDAGRLTFYTVSHGQVRHGQPESDIYEVEYGIMERDGKQLFTRRVWPNPHKDRDPGGLLTMLSERIGVFQFRFFDGQEWRPSWSEETDNLPELIEVTLVARAADNRPPVVRQLLINYKRGTGENVLEGSDDGN